VRDLVVKLTINSFLYFSYVFKGIQHFCYNPFYFPINSTYAYLKFTTDHNKFRNRNRIYYICG